MSRRCEIEEVVGSLVSRMMVRGGGGDGGTEHGVREKGAQV